MATKMITFKMDEAEIDEMKYVADVFDMTTTDLIKDSVRAYIKALKSDPIYKLTSNIEDASTEESEELLGIINNMSDDDLKIVKTERFSV